MRLAALLLLVLGCKDGRVHETPAPMLDETRCRVARFEGSRATDTWCPYEGHWWQCVYSAYDRNYTCFIKDPLPTEKK